MVQGYDKPKTAAAMTTATEALLRLARRAHEAETKPVADARVTSGTEPAALDTARLGYTQKLVLRLLASGSKSAQYLAYDWPGLTASSARSAVMRLAGRGLVDVAGWDNGGRRTYCLTDKGVAAERAINLDAEDEDDG